MRRAGLLLILIACRHHAAPVQEHARERPGEDEDKREHRHVDRPTTAEARMKIAELAAVETRRERARPAAQPAWTSLGPRGGSTIDNSGLLSTAESGLVNGLRVDPRDPNVVFIATSGGGIWRTSDITAATPDWRSITDQLGNLGIGGFDIDPQHPDTIVIGLGEPYYVPGGFVQITRDGGQTYGAPVPLGQASNVREVRIDPGDSNLVLVATDVGLFRSIDGGASFTAIELPDAVAGLEQAMWSVAYTGRDASGSHWAVSGVSGCAVGVHPPEEGGGIAPSAGCPRGNPGHVWTSSDGGATWTMTALPVMHNYNGQVAVAGRMTLASSGNVVYAMVANRDERATQTIDILRSNDGGATFASAKGPVTDPDTVCVDLDVGSVQSSYNQAIAVDPAHPERVVVAGLFCSVRTVDGTSATPTWQVVSDVYSHQTATSCGQIPYVHSDFHAALITPTGRLLLGGDGGIEASDDALTIANGNECSTQWIDANRGLATHLSYSLTSGDPMYGDGDVIYTGLQDLSSRWRDPAHADQWNTINLSDGTGGAIARDGDQSIYWAAQVSSTMDRTYCRRMPAVDCGLLGSWIPSNPTLPPGDKEAFVTMLAPIAEGGVISHSQYHVWRADGTPAWSDISGQHCEPSGACTAGSFSPYYIDSVAGSPTTAAVYAAAMFDHTAVTSDGGATWSISAPLGLADQHLAWVQSSVALPPGGTGDTYVAGSAAELLDDYTTGVPDAVGHVFITHDRGATWSSLAGTGADALPNVPVWQVKYDPRDASARTIYAATELGLYQTSDGGMTWARAGSGLPMVRTTDVALASDGSFVRISTWGRGIWELRPNDPGKGDGMPPGGGGGGCCEGGSHDVAWPLALVVGIQISRRRRRSNIGESRFQGTTSKWVG
jgi:hypothetical protein